MGLFNIFKFSVENKHRFLDPHHPFATCVILPLRLGYRGMYGSGCQILKFWSDRCAMRDFYHTRFRGFLTPYVCDIYCHTAEMIASYFHPAVLASVFVVGSFST